ncbi:hypothetical protein DFP73DRAFT_608270 [Morchella snyderi]|nr:hypothetical protein DFP73DRAFT_608270 [Morchella snyderi]
MSHPIFSSAPGRAILRRPPSAPLLLRPSPHPLLHPKRHSRPAVTPTTAAPPTTAACCHRRPKTLLALLHLLGRALDIPSRPRPGKADLTFHDPLSRGAALRRPPKPQPLSSWRLRRAPAWSRGWLRGAMSLKSITYEYMYHFLLPERGPEEEEEEAAVDAVFGGGVLEYLGARGYAAEDVVGWAWVLMAADERQAALRIDVWARLGAVGAPRGREGEGGGGGESLKDAVREIVDCHVASTPARDAEAVPQLEEEAQRVTRSPRIPPFIILHNLRRPHSHIGGDTLRRLLPHVQQALRSPQTLQAGDTKTPLLLLIRLLRHARSSWPPIIPHVADLMAKLHHHHPPKRSARLTATYNRLLALLSLPPNDRPFQRMPLLQQAQFTLLRAMAALDIPITREGYRALAAVQLAHPKTPTEAQHASSQSTNWPPWPVPKDGHRLTPGQHPPCAAEPAPHLSRAALVLQQMTAAGYHNLGWEKEALVLAGTDTDASPTIQTRTFHHAGRASARPHPANIWAVRVRATRTLDEAWRVFLDCMAATGVPPPAAWEELFYKACSARKVSRLLGRHQQRLQAIRAGHDGARAPTEATLRAVERWELAQRDVGEWAGRVMPGDAREVAAAVAAAAAPQTERVYVPVQAPGVEELFAMMRRVCGRRARVSVRLLAHLVREAETLEEGERLLTAWSAERFRRLVKTAPTAATTTPRSDDWPLLASYLTLLLRTPTPPRLSLALRLLHGHAPPHPPAWNAVLSALCALPATATAATAAARLALVWRLYTAMPSSARGDAGTLRLLCVAAARSPAGVGWGGEAPVDAAAGAVEAAFGIVGGGEGVPLVAAEAAALHAKTRIASTDTDKKLAIITTAMDPAIDPDLAAGERAQSLQFCHGPAPPPPSPARAPSVFSRWYDPVAEASQL